MTCEFCTHTESVHSEHGCRVTGCGCSAFAAPETPEPRPTHRKVCVDVPDGYAVTFSLIPEKADG